VDRTFFIRRAPVSLSNMALLGGAKLPCHRQVMRDSNYTATLQQLATFNYFCFLLPDATIWWNFSSLLQTIFSSGATDFCGTVPGWSCLM